MWLDIQFIVHGIMKIINIVLTDADTKKRSSVSLEEWIEKSKKV